MEKRWSSLKKIACFLAIMLLIVTTLYPLVVSDFVLPEWGGGMVHSDPQMSENIRLPLPTENVGELWYSEDYGGELIGCFGNGIAGNGNISATTFNLPFFHKNLMIYDYYGNRLWTDKSILNFMACSSTPMVDKYNRVVACDNETIIMVNASDLDNIEVEWTSSISLAPLENNFPTTPLSPTIMENETIILPSSNGPVFIFDVNTGELLEEIYPGANETINPFWGLPQMTRYNYRLVMEDHYINSICPYRYNSTSELIEWNSSVPFGIFPIKNWIFFDGNYRFYVNNNNVIVLERDGLDWVQLASNDIGTPQNCTGEGYYTTKNSACVENNTVYLSTEYYKEGFEPYNTTIGRLYAINVTRDFENGTVDWEEYWNYTYSGTAKASPVLIDDTIFFDGYNDTEFAEDRDPHIYAMYTNGTERWNVSYPNITLFSMAADPRGGVWYEDSDGYNPYGQGGNKLVRFSEEDGSIIEEIDIKTLIGDTSEEPVLPCSTMTICGNTGNYIMLMSANKPHANEGKWVLAINLSDNNSLIWQVPIESKFDWNYAGGEYVIGTENNVSRVIFGTFFGGVMAIGSHPDTWFENLSYELWDKPDDGDSDYDSVNVSFSIRACLPHDLATVEVALISEDYPIILRKTEIMEYPVNTSDTDDNITVTLPGWFIDGEYKLRVYLFNSSGKFKSEHLNYSDILKFDMGLYANETHEYGPFSLYPSNSKPNPPHTPSGETEVENWGSYPYTTNTTDIDNDYLYYKWGWDTILLPIYTTWDILNPYQSGENCTQDIGWMFPGTYDISVQAKDHWLSIDPTNWSEPLTVNVSKSDDSSGSWSNPLLDSFSANAVAVNEQTSCTGFNSEVYIEQGSRSEFTWDWDFGDGNTSNDEEVSHNYSQVGNYTVNLTLTYQGDEYNVSTVIEVLPLKARYSTSSDGAQPYVNIVFNDTSQGLYNITNHTWDFDDGAVSYEPNVSHSFESEGVYNVTLTVTDNESNINTHYQIIHVETTAPTIIYVDESPHTVGFGSDVNIYADFYDNESQIDSVSVHITYPDNSSGNFSMSKNLSCPYDFEYLFNDTWRVGLYKYSIWVYDNAGNSNVTGLFNFSVSADATISVCTIKDTYGAGEDINITDPPVNPTNSDVGYELLDDGDVLHIWNKYDSYYFNTSSGIQLTNHYDEYWSHNVLMLGYYNNDQWNLIYRTDELSGFNKDIETDNETYVNATLWKDLTYNGYDFRLAIRYHLGVDDNELTVIPYIKNIDEDDIPYVLGFGWEMKNIQIDMTYSGDYIDVNQTMHYLNQTLDNTYTDLLEPEFYLMENITDTSTKSLYLRWNKNLTYALRVKSRTGQYNAPVTLFIRIGTLDSGQEKYTSMYWYDADQVTYYFNSYNEEEAWAKYPDYMVDGSTSNFAIAAVEEVELCDANSYSGGSSGAISKVELRAHGYDGEQGLLYLRPVFNGESDGDNHSFDLSPIDSWSPYFDITSDTNAPSSWSWSDIANLDCDVEAVEGEDVYCSKVEIRITYDSHIVEAEYYFIDEFESDWEDPENMVDGDDESFAYAEVDTIEQKCLRNTCEGEDLGDISKVELRVCGYYENHGTTADISLTPVFNGRTYGSEYIFDAPEGEPAAWSEWFDITNDGNFSEVEGWSWDDVHELDCVVEAAGNESEGFVLYCSKVDIRVTYIDNDAPVISNPYPVSGYVGISPVLNITVSDGDGDSMNITWYSNSTQSTLTLRPTANGSVTQLDKYPESAANYECVNEEIVNDSDYVKWIGSTWKKDTYELANHASETGAINHVKVYVRCARIGYWVIPAVSSYAKITVKSGGSYYYGDQFKPSNSADPPFTYSNYSYTWTSNPATGDAWAWNDIDGLEAGISFIGTEGQSRCTHLYVEVNYINPSTWIAFGANNSINNGTYHQTFADASVNGQWWYWKVTVTDGIDNTASSVYKFHTGSQSKIENTGSTNFSGYLLIQVQYNNSGDWVVDNDTINETTPRTINVGQQLALDLIFNGKVSTDDLVNGDGTYRVYAAFRDPDGDVLVCDDESLLEAWWEFTVDAT